MALKSFTPETAKLAGLRSLAVRRAKNQKTMAEKALEDTMTLKGLLHTLLGASKCDKCGRSGPKTTAEYVDIVKTLLQLNTEILNRIKGKPPTETTSQRFGSVDEYRKASQALDEVIEESTPNDLPDAPSL